VAHSYTNLLYHIVFATLERRRLISGEFASRLHQYLGGMVRGLGGISLGVNGAEDHIHMLAKLHQDLAVSEFRRFCGHITSISSRNTCYVRHCRPPCGLSLQNHYYRPAPLRCSGGYMLATRFAGSDSPRLFKM
jgi:REP element-mobilizing transposase RayT